MTEIKMNLKIQYVLGLLLTVFLLIMILKDPSDRNTSIFAFILYSPYVIALCLYNGLFLKLTDKLKNKPYYYLLPIVPGVIWLLLSSFKLTVRFWKLNVFESVTLILLWILANQLTPYILKNNTNKSEQL